MLTRSLGRDRKHLGAAALAAVLVAAPIPALAETQPIARGDASPLTGLVMDEATFTRYANADVARAKCAVDLTAANAAVAAGAAAAASTPPPTASASFWLGAGVGAVVTVAVLYGAAQLLRAAPAQRLGRSWEPGGGP